MGVDDLEGYTIVMRLYSHLPKVGVENLEGYTIVMRLYSHLPKVGVEVGVEDLEGGENDVVSPCCHVTLRLGFMAKIFSVSACFIVRISFVFFALPQAVLDYPLRVDLHLLLNRSAQTRASMKGCSRNI